MEAAAVIIAIILAAIGIFIYDIFWYSRNALSKVQRSPAIVIRKHGVSMFVTFACDGKEMAFAVPEYIYGEIDEGDEGLLTYRGEQFKHFVSADQVTGGDFVG